MSDHPGNGSQSDEPATDFSPSDLLKIHENKLHELKRIRLEREGLIQQARLRNEELRKRNEKLTQKLNVTREKIREINLSTLEQSRDSERESLKRAEEEYEELENGLLMFGINMQKDLRELASPISHMHMEFGTTDRMENGVRTLMQKSEETRKQCIEADKKIGTLQEAILRAKEADLISLNGANIILSAAENTANAKKNAIEILKQEIRQMGATPMSKEQVAITMNGFSELTL